MAASISLRWKILAWFFVNLAVIGLAVCGFLLVQFRLGMNSLIAGSTDDRLEAIAQPLANNLRRLPSEQWNAALNQAVAVWRERGVQAAIFRNDGTFVAGDISALPAEVKQEIARQDTRRHPRPPGPGGRPPGPPHRHDEFEHRPDSGPGGLDGPVVPGNGHLFGPAAAPHPLDLERTAPPIPPLNDFGPPKPPGEPGGPRGVADRGAPPAGGPHGPADAAPKRLDKFMLVAGNPRLYWTGVSLGEIQRPSPGGPIPSATLVLASSSLSGGGLFFDYLPWLLLGSALAVISILWWLPFVHGLTRSLTRMTGVAEEIARGQFRPLPPVKRRDELGRLGRALSHMSGRLEGYVTGQRRFLGDTAHELLSPLARLEVALSILEQKINAPGDRRYVDRSLEEVRHMSLLVNDLLAYTKAGLRAQSAEVRPVAVAEIARQAVAREVAEEKVVVDVPEDCRVSADPDLLLRALCNGVRNAVRYAGDGGPIAITAAPSAEPANGMVDVSVVDHGPGVPPEAIDKLFDPFFRPEDARTRETGGTGLGLAIVKSCVEACGGSVSVRNRVPVGLELTFRLKTAGKI